MKVDTDALQDIFGDLLSSLLSIGETKLQHLIDVATARADEFLTTHAASPNYMELAEHSLVQIEQEAAIAALQLDREVALRVRTALLSSLRLLAVGLRTQTT